MLCGILLGWMIGGSLNDFKTNLPKYQQRLTDQSHGSVHLVAELWGQAG